MPQYRLVMFTRPVEGREEEYNHWYQNVHLREVLAVQGFKSAQRFHLHRAYSGREVYPYMAIYEIETNDIDAVLAEVDRRRHAEMKSSDAISPMAEGMVYEVFGPIAKA